MRLVHLIVPLTVLNPFAPAVALAQEDIAPLSFGDEEPLEVTCQELSKGVTFDVLNDSARPQDLHVRLAPLRDSDGGFHRAEDICGQITIRPRTAVPGRMRMSPGGSRTLRLKATDSEPGGDATYTTTLVAFARNGPASRRDVKVSLATTTPVKPLVASQDITHHRHNPKDEWMVLVPVKVKPGQTPALTKGTTVGALTGEGGTTAVTYDGAPLEELTDQSSLLPLHIQPIGAGTYKGKLELIPEAGKGTVDLTLTAKDWWPRAVACLMVGILLALAIQRWNGYRRPTKALRARVDGTTTLLRNAQKKLKDKAGDRSWGEFTLKDLDSLKRELHQIIDARVAGTFIQIDQKIIDDLNAKVDGLEAKISMLVTFGELAADLDRALELERTRRPTKSLPPRRGSDLARHDPRLAEAVEKLMQPEQLSADDLAALAAQLPEMTKIVQELTFSEWRLAHYWILSQELGKPGNVDGDLLTKLTHALMGIRHGLWNAADDAEMKGVLDELEKAREQIDTLWPSLHTTQPSPALQAQILDVGNKSVRPVIAAESGLPASGTDVGGVADGVELAEGVPGSLATPAPLLAPFPGPVLTARQAALTPAEARRASTYTRRIQYAVVAVSLAVAIVTGLSTLYVGKTWGTTWDYIWTIAWGLGVQTIIQTIAGTIDGLGAVGALRRAVQNPAA